MRKRLPHDRVRLFKDIKSGHVDQLKRAHGHAEIDHGPIDLGGARPFFQQPESLHQIGDEEPIDDEALAVRHEDGRFADRLGQSEGRGSHLGGGPPRPAASSGPDGKNAAPPADPDVASPRPARPD